MNIPNEILKKMSTEALKALIEATTKEYNSRMDFSLRVNEPCYAIVKGKRVDFSRLIKKNRTRAEVVCAETGTIFTIAYSSLMSDGREKEVSRPLEEVSGVPVTKVTNVW